MYIQLKFFVLINFKYSEAFGNELEKKNINKLL